MVGKISGVISRGNIIFHKNPITTLIRRYVHCKKEVYFKKKDIFTFKKFTKLVREKYPLLQLDCNKWNYK